MDENPQQDEGRPASGNRWEPPAGDSPGEPAASAPPPAWTPVDHGAAATPPTDHGPWWRRSRAGLAAGATALLLAVGLGGFAVGRATAGDGQGDRTSQPGVPSGSDRDGDGNGLHDGAGVPNGPGVPGGGPPGSGQVPDMPGPDDGQQDDGTDGSDT